ncbi:MAG: heparinase II/III family protein, partial [Rariglobus sp.]
MRFSNGLLVLVTLTGASGPLFSSEPAAMSDAAVFRPPGLVASPADFDRLRGLIAQPGLHRDLFSSVKACAERELGEPVVERKVIGRRMLYASRAVLRRTVNGSMAYQISGDKRYARRVLADLLAAAGFSDWNPSHFLDAAEMSCAFALGLDWLQSAMTQDERLRLEDALIRLGLEPSLDPPDKFWLTADNNWNAVCHGSLLMGALAVRHRRPDLAGTIIARAVAALPRHGLNFAPDGAFAEGPMYWDYGTTFHVLAVEALARATGSAQGLDTLPGFRESGAYMVHATGPGGAFFNYSDCRPERMALPALAWFGRHYNEPALTRAEADHCAQAIRAPLPPDVGEPHRFLALTLLWLDPDHLKSTAPATLPVSWSGRGSNPVAFWRDSWSPDATWVGAKGGRATLSHGHIDAGSFVFEAGGVRWAVDPGMEEYHRIESMGINL